MNVLRNTTALLCSIACVVGCSEESKPSGSEQGGTSNTGPVGTAGATSPEATNPGATNPGATNPGAPGNGGNGGSSGNRTTGATTRGGNGGTSGNHSGTTLSGGGTTTGSAPPPSGVYRPYNSTSPWNTPIGDSPKIDPESAAMIADFEASSPVFGEHLDINIKGYSIPLYWADENTPRVKVTCGVGGHGFTGDDGQNATVEMPFPPGAQPDPETDHHILIVDRSTNTEYGLWNFSIEGSTYKCGTGATQDLNGNGIRPPEDEASHWYEAHGPRACGFGSIAGLIRPEEVEAGVIEHALVLAYPHIRSQAYVSPASTAQVTMGTDAIPTRGIPCGGRLQYDPSIDVNSLKLSAAAKVVLRALQVYGAFVGDYSGAISIYADNSPEAKAKWTSMGLGSNGFDDFMYAFRDTVDLADFRVLEIGAVHEKK